MSDVRENAAQNYSGLRGDAPVEMGRVQGAVSRLGQANERFRQQMQLLEMILDRLCGGMPKNTAAIDKNHDRPSRPDLDELDDVAQNLIDCCSHIEDLVQRASAL